MFWFGVEKVVEGEWVHVIFFLVIEIPDIRQSGFRDDK